MKAKTLPLSYFFPSFSPFFSSASSFSSFFFFVSFFFFRFSACRYLFLAKRTGQTIIMFHELYVELLS